MPCCLRPRQPITWAKSEEGEEEQRAQAMLEAPTELCPEPTAEAGPPGPSNMYLLTPSCRWRFRKVLLPDGRPAQPGPGLSHDCMGWGRAGLLGPPQWQGGEPGPLGTLLVLAGDSCSQSQQVKTLLAQLPLSSLSGSPLEGPTSCSFLGSSTAPPAGPRCLSTSTGF